MATVLVVEIVMIVVTDAHAEWKMNMNSMVDIAQKYTDLKPKSNGEFVGICPLHDEKTPSFSVNVEKNIFYCFGCQAGGGVKELCRLLGIDPPINGAPRKKFVRVKPRSLSRLKQILFPYYKEFYEYRDIDGNLFALKVRKEINGKKTFRIASKGDDPSCPAVGWRYGGYISKKLYLTEKIPLYTGHILVVEGERAADCLLRRGIACLGVPGSSANPDMSFLRDRHLVFWPDYDRPGVGLMWDLSLQVKNSCVIRTYLTARAFSKEENDKSLWGMDALDLRIEDVRAILDRYGRFTIGENKNGKK